MLAFLASLVNAIGPQVLGVALPLLLTHGAKSLKAIESRVPKQYWPWISALAGAASAMLPNMPDAGHGLQNGLLAAGLYSGLKFLHKQPKMLIKASAVKWPGKPAAK